MKLYIGNLAADCTESDLRALLAPFGEIVELDLKAHHRSESPLRFALVTMADEPSALAAIDTLDNTELHDRPIRVMKAFVRPELPEIPKNGPNGG